jgi:L-alanine-DL-glutamate epimerase-like enolase superfamily enzyme
MGLHAASVLRSMPFACELSEHEHLLDDPFDPLPRVGGSMAVPTGPGTGIGRAAGAAH